MFSRLCCKRLLAVSRGTRNAGHQNLSEIRAFRISEREARQREREVLPLGTPTLLRNFRHAHPEWTLQFAPSVKVPASRKLFC